MIKTTMLSEILQFAPTYEVAAFCNYFKGLIIRVDSKQKSKFNMIFKNQYPHICNFLSMQYMNKKIYVTMLRDVEKLCWEYNNSPHFKDKVVIKEKIK